MKRPWKLQYRWAFTDDSEPATDWQTLACYTTEERALASKMAEEDVQPATIELRVWK